MTDSLTIMPFPLAGRVARQNPCHKLSEGSRSKTSLHKMILRCGSFSDPAELHSKRDILKSIQNPSHFVRWVPLCIYPDISWADAVSCVLENFFESKYNIFIGIFDD